MRESLIYLSLSLLHGVGELRYDFQLYNVCISASLIRDNPTVREIV